MTAKNEKADRKRWIQLKRFQRPFRFTKNVRELLNKFNFPWSSKNVKKTSTAKQTACANPDKQSWRDLMTRDTAIKLIPVTLWWILFNVCGFIPPSYRPPIDVKTLPYIESLYGFPHHFVSEHHHAVLDVLAVIPYTLHCALPALFLVYLLLRHEKRDALSFVFTFGVLSFTAVLTEVLMPTAPPWYFDYYKHKQAVYGMYGHPGSAMLRVDKLLGQPFYRSIYKKSPLVFGSFPSLHAGWPFLIALFRPGPSRFGFFYVAWVWWAALYLQHHYLVDILGGAFYAFLAHKLCSGESERLSPLQNPKHIGFPSSHSHSQAVSVSVEFEMRDVEAGSLSPQRLQIPPQTVVPAPELAPLSDPSVLLAEGVRPSVKLVRLCSRNGPAVESDRTSYVISSLSTSSSSTNLSSNQQVSTPSHSTTCSNTILSATAVSPPSAFSLSSTSGISLSSTISSSGSTILSSLSLGTYHSGNMNVPTSPLSSPLSSANTPLVSTPPSSAMRNSMSAHSFLQRDLEMTGESSVPLLSSSSSSYPIAVYPGTASFPVTPSASVPLLSMTEEDE
eukprot:TRINITY_DN3218_c0_g1::TRINITY_DN3218_c0_g1_i1::g.29701::m.29701 TRINITY_DN3218_c0_g1::TRINITY_DN3218_c0_g1_i1::g.29701  ORF type:complete len:560 (+),score=59.56,sp/Q10142/AUR1_SCHPO/37.96/3e-37,PAP2/PF01569.16/1.4e+03,PAP2/PF01569.16/8.3e-07,PAP2/PF01569.16/6.2e+02,PAP2_3/PF14378.1/2.3e-05,DUF3353/PF11833.3/0.28,DUF3353/PF11833.3/2.1e+03,DUF2029/PF09594.5/4.6e+03,DUF2029/PF09594.5/0.16 TRINITY_DN3218_c0_g1_i1:124-1803(+)